MRQRLECAPADWMGIAGAAPAKCNGAPDFGDRLDEATAAYVLAMQTPFELLRQAVAQLAGVLVLAASGSRQWPGHPMLAMAEAARREAEDAVRAAEVPAAARHHHRHLVQAAGAIAGAEGRLRGATLGRNDEAIADGLAAVQAACRELQWSTAALPGFAMIDLTQSCCAAHVASRQGGPAQ